MTYRTVIVGLSPSRAGATPLNPDGPGTGRRLSVMYGRGTPQFYRDFDRVNLHDRPSALPRVDGQAALNLFPLLFNAFLCKKMPTMTMGGGNTDELYKDDGRLQMAESLRQQHPDIVTVTEKWGRPQHHVDYSRFRHNRLAPVSGGGR